MSIKIQLATESDVADILALVNHYAEANITLPIREEGVRAMLADWVVAFDTGSIDTDSIDTGAFVGCGALVALTDELVEVRSLAIAADQQGKGTGRLLVNQLVEMARVRGFAQVCALTLTEGFFTKLGFHLVDRWSISPKVWQACIYCPKFHRCDEVAVLMDLEQPHHENKQKRHDGWNGLLKYNSWQPLKLAYQKKPKNDETPN